jgi:transposase
VAVVDAVGRLLATESFPTTRHGYRRLLRWLRSHRELVAVGVEGCGSCGAGVARYLAARSVKVVEVNQSNRQKRRMRGKSDTLDAEAAARAVLSGEATATPEAGTGPVEALRRLRIALNSLGERRWPRSVSTVTSNHPVPRQGRPRVPAEMDLRQERSGGCSLAALPSAATETGSRLVRSIVGAGRTDPEPDVHRCTRSRRRLTAVIFGSALRVGRND